MFKKEIKELSKLIKKSEKILLISHIRMDPDTFGSVGALYYILKKLGKKIKTTNDDIAPESFSFMGANNIITQNINIKKYNPDLIISLDAASLGQLGNIYLNNKKEFKEKLVMIDHHATNKGYGILNIIDKDSSSTCELVYEIIKELKLEKYINKKIATLLLAGIYTDTNIFYNSNTSSKTLKIASELMDYKGNSREAMYNFFKKRTLNKSKLWGEVLKDLKEENNGKIVWGIIKKETFEKTNTTDMQTSGLINEFLINIEGVKVCFLLYELEKGGVKASFRSQKFNVSKFCKQFGGGGHKNAAGFTLYEDIENIENDIIKKLKKEL